MKQTKLRFRKIESFSRKNIPFKIFYLHQYFTYYNCNSNKFATTEHILHRCCQGHRPDKREINN